MTDTQSTEYIYRILAETEEDLYQSDLRLLKECFRTEARAEVEEINIFKDILRAINQFINTYTLRWQWKA